MLVTILKSDESTNDKIVDDEYTNDKPINDDIPTIDIEFRNKRGLYHHYEIDTKTIPNGYEVKMRYNKINDKRGPVYKLVKK